MKKHIFLDEELLSEVSNTLAQILGAEKVQGFSQNDLVVYALKQLLCKPLSKPDSGASEVQELHCVNRILFQGSNWCVTNPPKMVQLKTLEICKVCKQRRLGLTEKTLSPSLSASQPVLPQKPQEPQFGTDPKINATPYCPEIAMKVYYRKCENCQTPCDKAPDSNKYIPTRDRDRRRLAQETIPQKKENQT